MIETYGPHHKKKKHKKLHMILILVGTFSLILFLLIYTSFYSGEISLTGNVVLGDILNLNKSVISKNTIGGIELDSELTIPTLEIDGEFEKLEIRGSSNSYIIVGNQKFDLGDIKENYLVFYNYNGKITFDSKNILELKGKSREISVNGIFVTSKSDSTSKIDLKDILRYKSLEIEEGVSISELNYIASGTINLNNKDQIFNINNEEIKIKNFDGNLLIKDKKMYLDGNVKELEILGEPSIKIKD